VDFSLLDNKLKARILSRKTVSTCPVSKDSHNSDNLCLKIVLHHNGSITVESATDTGTTFIVSFPRFTEDMPEIADTE
jgi:sensor histidine kinase regulating citrate/malate metabolism